MSDSATKQSKTALPKHRRESGCLLRIQPMRGTSSDPNYRAVTDWLTAEEPGGRPAESTVRRAGVCGGCASVCESSACVVLVGGRDEENIVWNHKSSG